MTFCFSDFIPNYETKKEIGVAYSLVILFSVFLNTIAIITDSLLIPIIKRFKKNYKSKTLWKKGRNQRRKTKIQLFN